MKEPTINTYEIKSVADSVNPEARKEFEKRLKDLKESTNNFTRAVRSGEASMAPPAKKQVYSVRDRASHQ